MLVGACAWPRPAPRSCCNIYPKDDSAALAYASISRKNRTSIKKSTKNNVMAFTRLGFSGARKTATKGTEPTDQV